VLEQYMAMSALENLDVVSVVLAKRSPFQRLTVMQIDPHGNGRGATGLD